ncbi:MAG: nucleotidyltransferase domain-containing protein, partial [Ktedonobacteraceae bacterium]|nr:nucleotidyltransferase domain-containing protein [Ktedonobacteraceae bacterium]
MQKAQPLVVATTLVRELFPTCQVALLAGSLARGEGHPNSDLDIVVIDQQATPHWETRLAHGWPVELFVFTPATVEAAFALDVRRRWPLHLTLCQEGQIIAGQDAVAAPIKERASQMLAAGPAALTPAEIAQKRYDLTWRLDDFADATPGIDLRLIGHDLLVEAADMHLVHQRHWRGRGGKWTLRMLRQAEPARAQAFSEALVA